MQHLEDGYLHEIADGEVPSADLVAVREHLDACESCRTRLDQARMEAETARELVELIEVPELLEVGAVREVAFDAMYTQARRMEPTGLSLGTTGSRRAAEPPKRKSTRWVGALAWAASLVLAAGIGYMNRPQMQAAVNERLEPTSLGRIDTVYLDDRVPAQPVAPESDGVVRDALSRASNAPPAAASPQPASPAPERQNAAGARPLEEQSSKRKFGSDTSIRLDEVVVTGAVTAQKKLESKDVDAKAQEGVRERAPSDAREQAAAAQRLRRSEAPPAAPSVAGAAAENRLMSKTAGDAAAVEVTFPRAVELLGGRIKLVEGMVPARLEAVGRTVRVLYEIEGGFLVLSQVSVPDSLNWNLSGPLTADSLAQLRLRVR